MTYTPLPIGIDDFEEIITKEYYYVDKNWFIKELEAVYMEAIKKLLELENEILKQDIPIVMHHL